MNESSFTRCNLHLILYCYYSGDKWEKRLQYFFNIPVKINYESEIEFLSSSSLSCHSTNSQ
ncbi:hypothetical protein DERP_004972 [Dermatophagoides pteronyssinus]|uniref:Uncharacterized protein n=1 Tax=Dermatophagoides pteronyssinus TaxID=6956 RepID=A0ABQ8JT01_DERPT|nr:hypothetical protein DERP_004972 [Dermatophagoides pteronyssinus]